MLVILCIHVQRQGLILLIAFQRAKSLFPCTVEQIAASGLAGYTFSY
jgi:hypothetical protein